VQALGIFTITGYDLMVRFRRRRYIGFESDYTAIALSVVCFEIAEVECGFGEGVSHLD